MQLKDSEQIFDRLRDGSSSEFRLQQELRHEFPDAVVRTALTLHELRTKAAAKFSRAAEMWFDRQGLEQATAEAVAQHKARRFQGQVWDFCSGTGSDAIALARDCQVNAVDNDAAACLRLKWNAEIYGVQQNLQIVCADAHDIGDRSGLLHIDPDRRAGGASSTDQRKRTDIRGRSVRIEDYVPGLEFLQKMTQEFTGGAIKLSPASNFGGKFSGTEVELISLHGECKEATIWFGELASDTEFRATVLPSGETLSGDPLSAISDTSPLQSFVYDPDPAVVRAGLVGVLAEHLEIERLDDAEEYLTSDSEVQSPFVRGFRVLTELPNNDRAIRQFFRKSDFGQVEIKCRHIRIQADTMRKKLPLNGNRPAVLFIARIAGKARAIVCERLD